jgi:hypothetical protein
MLHLHRWWDELMKTAQNDTYLRGCHLVHRERHKATRRQRDTF